MEKYEKEYHKRLHKNLLNNKRYYLFRARYSKENYLKYLKGSIVEFGCGMGQNIYYAKDNAIGVDISEFAVQECRKRGINAANNLDKIKGLYDGALSVHEI